MGNIPAYSTLTNGVHPSVTALIRKSRLFFGSYAILFALLALRFATPWLEVTFGILAAIGLADTLWIVIGVPSKTQSDPIVFTSVEDAGSDVAGYLVGYILPFLTVAQPSLRDLLAYGLFLLVLGIIFVQSNMVQVNPTLYVFRRRVEKVTAEGGWNGYLISSTHVDPGVVVHVVSLSGEVRVQTRKTRSAS
jgi:hypothetical protein